ncbi:MAG: CHASE3 domain-containing protein [Pseudomonadota bacterium]|nr:CHASE3 domain-containing protein [Pseudomonadota bacterium]
MKTWSVGKKIGAGYAIALFMLFLVGLISYRSTNGMIETVRMADHSYQVLNNLERLLSGLQDAETGQRGYLITGNEAYLQPYQAGEVKTRQILHALSGLTSDNPVQQNYISGLGPLVAAKFSELEKTIDLRREKGYDAALRVVMTNKGKDVMDQIRNVISEMKNEERTLLASSSEQEQFHARITLDVIEYGIPVAFVILVLGGSLIIRSITFQLKESISQLASSSSEILATTAQVASGATETASAINETTVTIEEVKQTAQLANQKAKDVSESAQRATQTSLDGKKSVEEAIQGMQTIQEQMESIAESILRLSEQGQTIGDIIVSVNNLAEQSNLLAVNAAIEANKAGEHGKGFAVVAQEIRSLAEQSKQATSQVRTILSDIQKGTSAAVLAIEQGAKAVDAGVRQSREAGQSIHYLSDRIAEAAQASLQIAASSQQQMVGMDQVALAMENIKQASMQNVSGSRQAETVARGLHELGMKLGVMIGIG